MFKKGTKLYSILFNKCPRCHEGEFMEEKNLLKLSKAFKMNESCEKCGLKYTIEPSFFYGAMYVSYGITVAIGVAVFVIATLFFKLSMLESFIPIVITLILFSPLTARLSRIIWINIFVKYDKNAISKKNG